MSYANALSVWKYHTVGTHTFFPEYIGAGVSRTAYRVESEVYKVETNFYAAGRINYFEAAASAFLREHYKIPGMIWPNFIIHTMPNGDEVSETFYVSRDQHQNPPYGLMRRIDRLFWDLGINDMGWGNNIFYVKGHAIPIDLGYWPLDRKRFWDPQEWVDHWENMRQWQEREEIAGANSVW